MIRSLAILSLVSFLFAGCASVPMQSEEASEQAKQFNPPAEGNAGLYIYRDGALGGALKKDLWVDGKCIGQSAPNVFFYQEVAGDRAHTVSTESEFSPNDLRINTNSGELYFIRQYIKLGVFVGGADLEVVDDTQAKATLADLGLAKKGECS